MTTPPPRPDEAYAIEQDANDPLRGFRAEFAVPRVRDLPASARAPHGDRDCVYLAGNSLGLMPKATAPAMAQEIEDWRRLALEGHVHAAHAWLPAHEFVREPLARLVGALPREVVAMNSLTVNLHLLLVSFYRPTRERFAIVIEDSAFPSDSYAVRSQLEFHARSLGFDAARGLIRLTPRAGESTLRTGDIVEALERRAGEIALVMLGGVNYLTGQCFDMPEITRHARRLGIAVGWDLAHAAGNIDARLHDWGPDFACWCSYKYLNSGPGAIAGAFVHERHLNAGAALPRFAGWWGSDPATRFRMGPDFVAVASADAWQLSNPPIFAMTPLRVSLDVFDRATMPALRDKSRRLTAYVESLVNALPGQPVRIVTPAEPPARGCQLSLVVAGDARKAHDQLAAEGVVCDFREPNVIRAAPVPLYNTFRDGWEFVGALRRVLKV